MTQVVESLSFDGMVGLYDETRDFNRNCFDAALDYICDRFPPQSFGKLLEPGIGTGRIAIPLAQRGYQITGIDISAAMLTFLKRRIAQFRPLQAISFHRADVTVLPFPDRAFDMAMVVHLFYFIADWQRAAREILRAIGNHQPIILMHTGMGAEIPFLNERYKALCAGQGRPIPSIGVKSTKEVTDFFGHLGWGVQKDPQLPRFFSRFLDPQVFG